jgi:formamidopyrimidine-DNA glycosylase
MPELPEVEVTRRGIAPHLEGRTIEHTVVRHHGMRWPIPAALPAILQGLTVLSVTRRGKYLLLECGPGVPASRKIHASRAGWLILHLGMTGSLRMVGPDTAPGKHEHFDLTVGQGTQGRKALDLEAEGRKALDLKTEGHKALDLEAKGREAQDLEADGREGLGLTSHGSSAGDLKAAGSNIRNLKSASSRVQDLKSGNSTAMDPTPGVPYLKSKKALGPGLPGAKTLRLNDPRRFGAVLWHPAADGPPHSHPLLAGLGVEPLSPALTPDLLFRATRGRKASIKQALLAGDIVVGVGNIYASETLFRAGIRPTTAAGRISLARFQKLVPEIRAVLREAIAKGGSTLRDFHSNGQAGYFQLDYFVYDRAGQDCKVCGTAIRRVVQGQRSTFYCVVCQR